MTLGIRSQITGTEAMRARLRAIGDKIERKVTRQAVAAGSKEFLRGVKTALHAHDTGALALSLGSKVWAGKGGKVQVGIIGPRTGAISVGRGAKRRRKLSALGKKLAALGGKIPAFYAHLVEGGAAAHAIGKGSSLHGRISRKTGKVLKPKLQTGRMHPGAKKQPFMGPGYRASESAALAAVQQTLADGIAAAARS